MRKFLSIFLVVMLLTTGCSLIGQKASKDDEPIIPAAVDSVGQEVNANASAADSSAVAANSETAGNSTVSSSAVIENSEDLFSNNILLDNGTGKGVSANINDKSSVLITLYYRDKEGLLIPVTRSVSKQEGLAKAAISGLIDQAVTREQLDYYGLYPVLPQGTKIRGMTIKNGSAVIDFSKEFTNLNSKEEEQLAVTSVVYTLTGFNTIKDVSIRIDGRDVKNLNNGTDISGKMNRENTFINSKETSLKEGYIKCDLYYMTTCKDQYNYMLPVSTLIQKPDDNQLPALMFAELSKKPAGDNLYTTFPEGSRLLSFSIEDDLAVLDFSSQLTNYGGNEKENILLNQIYYTINQLRGISKAKILIDGKEITMPEGSEVAFARTLPTTVNSVIDN